MIIVSPSRACNQDRKGSDQARGSVPSHPPPKPTVASSLTSTYNLCLSGCLTHSLTHPLSLRPSVRPSVRPPARPPARPSVRAPHSPPSLSLFLSLSLDQHPEMRPFMAAVTLPNARGRVCRRLHRPGRPARAVIVRRPPLSTPSSPRGTPRHPSPPRAAGRPSGRGAAARTRSSAAPLPQAAGSRCRRRLLRGRKSGGRRWGVRRICFDCDRKGGTVLSRQSHDSEVERRSWRAQDSAIHSGWLSGSAKYSGQLRREDARALDPHTLTVLDRRSIAAGVHTQFTHPNVAQHRVHGQEHALVDEELVLRHGAFAGAKNESGKLVNGCVRADINGLQKTSPINTYSYHFLVFFCLAILWGVLPVCFCRHLTGDRLKLGVG